LVKDKTGAVWFDYVSDLGDGFDATYAIAYLLAQPQLQMKGYGDPLLPRGNLVVMGGDQVYPTATRDDYTVKMRLPYSLALPDQGGKSHPLILLIPGNHDWYDGLVSFLASFCRNDPTSIGDWQTRQQRSYFAAKVSDNWWIWGIDIALVRDMDQPQADYFVAIAKAMPQRANIILCSAEPGWYKAAEESDSFRTLTYISRIADHARDEHGNEKELKIALVLSGDSHHYAHYYVDDGAHYITSGGGGAFLHGTLELKPKITARWLIEEDDKPVTLRLRRRYPTRKQSKDLLDGNKNFGQRNRGLTWAWAGLYLVYSFALTFFHTGRLNWDVALIELLVLAGGVWGYSRYQEGYSSFKIIAAAAAQAFAHMAVIVGISALAWWINERVLSLHWHWLGWLAYLAAFAVTLGRWAAGKIFGWSLFITCRKFGMNHNDAFSAMRLDSHRHFLRIRILDDTVTVFPIKLDKVPGRKGWRFNPENERDRCPSVFSPAVDMRPVLIEKPIEIRQSTTTTQVKIPGELPPDAR
jgi:Calcineurin-like phosphoesterase